MTSRGIFYTMDKLHVVSERGDIYRKRTVRYKRCAPSLYGAIRYETLEPTGMRVNRRWMYVLMRSGMFPRYELVVEGRHLKKIQWYLRVPTQGPYHGPPQAR